MKRGVGVGGLNNIFVPQIWQYCLLDILFQLGKWFVVCWTPPAPALSRVLSHNSSDFLIHGSM